MDFDRGQALIDHGVIEVAPLAFMRGRTLNDAFVILDEAQNTTPEQMKMFLTRLGFGSRAVITGDITQIDLPAGRASGLVQADRDSGQAVEGIRFVRFSATATWSAIRSCRRSSRPTRPPRGTLPECHDHDRTDRRSHRF